MTRDISVKETIAEKKIQLKPGLNFRLQSFLWCQVSQPDTLTVGLGNPTAQQAKGCSISRMLYYKRPDRPMIEMEFDFPGLECQSNTDCNLQYKISFQYSE